MAQPQTIGKSLQTILKKHAASGFEISQKFAKLRFSCIVKML